MERATPNQKEISPLMQEYVKNKYNISRSEKLKLEKSLQVLGAYGELRQFYAFAKPLINLGSKIKHGNEALLELIKEKESKKRAMVDINDTLECMGSRNADN